MGILINRNNYRYRIGIYTKHGSYYSYYCDDYFYDNADSTLTLYDVGVSMNQLVIGEFTEVTDYYAKQVK